MKRRFLRSGDELRDDESIVVRGGELEAKAIRADAARYFEVYETYGISVFALRDITLDELAQQSPLVRFKKLTIATAGVLRAAGFRLEATGRDRRHFTVAFDDLDSGVAALCLCEHRVWDNPYHES
jgi:hypothetical protein